MNKIKIIALAACAGMFAACDEYTLPNPPAQSNEPEVTFNTNDLSANGSVTAPVNLPALNEAGTGLNVMTYAVENLPEGSSLKFVGQLSPDPEFNPMAEFATRADEGNVVAGVYDIQDAFNAVVSRGVEAHKVYVRYAAYTVSGNQTVRIGGPDKWYGAAEYDVTPMPQSYIIEDEYYLIGSFCDWNFDQAIPFTHIGTGSVYDESEFMLKIDVTAEQANATDGFQWKVIPLSAYNDHSWDGALGVEVPDTIAGTLVAAPEAQLMAGSIKQEGPYIITIDLHKKIYDVSMAIEYLYVPGFGSSTTDFSRIMRLTTSNYVNYSGTMRLATKFWFTGQPSLEGISYRPDGADNEVSADGVLSGNMIYDVTSQGTMKVPTAGLYLVKADLLKLTWSATPIPVINLIGGFNGWDTATAPALTPDSKKEVWTIENVEMTAGPFKFCVNNAWTYSYGGTADNIVENGGNLELPEDGTYTIKLHFNAFPNYVEIIKQ